MTDKGKKGGDDEEDGDSLWRYVTRTVRPLFRDARRHPAPPKAKSPVTKAPTEELFLEKLLQQKPGLAAAPQAAAPQHPGAGLDRRSDRKLKRGQMEIEARLDLHGLTRERAHEELLRFIMRCHGRDMRCVLVITGKGRIDKPSILRAAVPDWLSSAPLAPLVLRFYNAQPKDGGAGALYILLRRQRE
ncbi:MAG: Smr/MutS family protein [Alphaproteobacteria bacterium]|nr:Smr/MutS family protein [Alphaproteobacteria bacterium]